MQSGRPLAGCLHVSQMRCPWRLAGARMRCGTGGLKALAQSWRAARQGSRCGSYWPAGVIDAVKCCKEASDAAAQAKLAGSRKVEHILASKPQQQQRQRRGCTHLAGCSRWLGTRRTCRALPSAALAPSNGGDVDMTVRPACSMMYCAPAARLHAILACFLEGLYQSAPFVPTSRAGLDEGPRQRWPFPLITVRHSGLSVRRHMARCCGAGAGTRSQHHPHAGCAEPTCLRGVDNIGKHAK